MSARLGLARALVALLSPFALHAQNATVRLAPASASVAPGTTLDVPVIVDFAGASGVSLASLTVRVAYDPARLTLQSTAPGSFGSVTSASPQPGTVTVTLFAAQGTSTTFTAATLRFQAGTIAGPTTLTPTVVSAGDEQGRSIASRVQAASSLAMCVGTVGEKWGDVSGDGQVDILDAQQVARHAVGLSVADAARLQRVGDVSGDGAIDILDAQQIARYTVGLGASPRLGQSTAASCGGSTSPTVAQLVLVSGGDQSAAPGATLVAPIVVRALSASGGPVAGASIAFTIAQGGGSVAGGAATTDASGQASTTWTLGPAAGAQMLTATSGTASVTVSAIASATGSSYNLVLDGISITQGVQRADNSIPLVRGRPMYVRALVHGNQPLPPGTPLPPVRLRWYANGVLQQIDTMLPTGSAMPTQRDDRQQGWGLFYANAPIGWSLLADVDPGQAVAESDRSDNVWPASGAPAPVSAVITPTLAVRFVPIVFASNGDRGDVSPANALQYITGMQRMHPISAYNVDVRAAAYVTTLPPVNGTDGSTWSALLKEIETLRTIEGGSRYYYGVVPGHYRSGTVGLGYVPTRLTATSAIGVDIATWSTHAPYTVAHEMGHNFGRLHAPSPEPTCGQPANPDPAFPYLDGSTGALGFDVWTTVTNGQATGKYFNPAPLAPETMRDLMGYCPDGRQWISDYTYLGILSFRSAGPAIASAAALAPTRTVIVSASVDSGGITLDPVLETDATPSPAAPGSPFRVRVHGERGELLVDAPVDATPVADAPRGLAHIVAALPLPLDASPWRVELTDGTRTASRVARSARPLELRADRVAPSRLRVRWNGDDYPLVLLRDPATHAILSIGRGGSATVPAAANELSVEASDGVRTARTRLAVPRR